MNKEEVMAKLQALGDEKMRKIYFNHGGGDNLFGVKMGDIRTLAKQIKTNPELAAELWKTGNVDAMLLAVLLMKPKALSAEELEQMVCSISYMQLADWLTSYVVKLHPQKEELRRKWMASDDPMAARAGWSLTTERVEKSPEGLDLGGLLDRIEAEMADAPDPSRWTMNFCLAAIGINFPEHRERALAIGEKLGVYRDYPTPKGCTSPFAPIWIREIVSRQSS
jgi:Predicted DNA alkylation repair enzyme